TRRRAPRRDPSPAHAAVKRLRRRGGVALHRDGPAALLLTEARVSVSAPVPTRQPGGPGGAVAPVPARERGPRTEARVLRALKPVAYLLALLPFALLVHDAFTDALGANPI